MQSLPIELISEIAKTNPTAFYCLSCSCITYNKYLKTTNSRNLFIIAHLRTITGYGKVTYKMTYNFPNKNIKLTTTEPKMVIVHDPINHTIRIELVRMEGKNNIKIESIPYFSPLMDIVERELKVFKLTYLLEFNRVV